MACPRARPRWLLASAARSPPPEPARSLPSRGPSCPPPLSAAAGLIRVNAGSELDNWRRDGSEHSNLYAGLTAVPVNGHRGGGPHTGGPAIIREASDLNARRPARGSWPAPYSCWPPCRRAVRPAAWPAPPPIPQHTAGLLPSCVVPASPRPELPHLGRDRARCAARCSARRRTEHGVSPPAISTLGGRRVPARRRGEDAPPVGGLGAAAARSAAARSRAMSGARVTIVPRVDPPGAPSVHVPQHERPGSRTRPIGEPDSGHHASGADVTGDAATTARDELKIPISTH